MNISELKKYAEIKGLNLGQAEKDYYQNLILFIIYNKVSKELIFKGGTALAKCYGLNRFSEDLDFTLNNETNIIEYIQEGLLKFDINFSLKEIKRKDSIKYKLKIEGPLYKNSIKNFCSITLDFSLREKTLLTPKIKTIGYHMDIIPVFEVYVLSESEILAEKIRAILTRDSARDLYDLVFLINKGIKLDLNLINSKLKWANQEFNKSKFLKKCEELNKIWQNELKSLVRNIPQFNEYYNEVEIWLK